MKKKVKVIFYILFWVFTVLFELYCLIVLNNDLFSVVAGGVVLLIATYLMIDTLLEWRHVERIQYMNEVMAKQDQSIEELKNQINDIEKYQKALYVYMKRSLQQPTDGKNSDMK